MPHYTPNQNQTCFDASYQKTKCGNSTFCIFTADKKKKIKKAKLADIK